MPDIGGTQETSTEATNGGSSTDGSMCGDGDNATGGLCYAEPTPVVTGMAVAALVAGELDGAAGIDLAIGHPGGITIASGGGDGSFVLTDQVASGSVVALAVADLDGDGLSELIAAHGQEGHVSIATNDGGSFADYVDIPLGAESLAPTSVASADFDDDGNADLVAVDAVAARVLLWIADGPGVFDVPLALDVGGTPGTIAVGDLGGDGAPDIAIPNLGATSVALLYFESGGFEIGPSVLVGGGPRQVALADLDGDGYDDLATADGADDSASIAFGSATGFASATAYVAGPQPRGVAIGDADNDGKGDVIVTMESANAIAVFLQGDGGAFFPAEWVATGPQPGAIAVGDYNADGLADVAVASAAPGGGVSVLVSDP
jgi:hypothetical protein